MANVMQAFMDGLMASPDVFIVGAALGFLIGKMMSRRRRGMGGMGF